MFKILFLFFGLHINHLASVPNNPKDTITPYTVKNSISLRDSFYVLRMNGHELKTSFIKQLKKTISANSSLLRKETLFIFFNHSSGDHFIQLSKVLREYSIVKRKIIVTDDYFKLPYK